MQWQVQEIKVVKTTCELKENAIGLRHPTNDKCILHLNRLKVYFKLVKRIYNLAISAAI